MSRRAAIAKALETELVAALDGTEGTTNIYGNVYAKNLSFDEVTDYPCVTITTGSEHRNYESSAIIWRFLTIYIRVYVSSEGYASEELELVMSDIEDYIDRNYELDYTVYRNELPTYQGTTTDANIVSTMTDEGALDPLAFGEITVSIRYHTMRPL